MATHYLISTAGFPNYGDEQIVRTWLAFFKKVHANDQIILDVPFPSRAQFLFKDEFPDLLIVDTIWNLIYLAESKGITLDDTNSLFELLHGGDPRNAVPIKTMFGADSLHLLGGGYFSVDHIEFKRTFYFFALLSIIKDKNPKTKIFATGLGLTPINSDIVSAIKEYVANFDYFGVRDRVSDLFPNATLEVDDVFLSKSLRAIKINKSDDNPDILVSIQPIFDDKIRKVVIENLIFFLKQHKNAKIGILEAMVPDDNWLYFGDVFNQEPDIKERLIFYDFWTLWTDGIPFKKNQLWISTRFHFHLIGALLGAKGTAISIGTQYYDVKHQSLIDWGTGWQFQNFTKKYSVIEPKINCFFQVKSKHLAEQKIKRVERMLYP